MSNQVPDEKLLGKIEEKEKLNLKQQSMEKKEIEGGGDDDEKRKEEDRVISQIELENVKIEDEELDKDDSGRRSENGLFQEKEKQTDIMMKNDNKGEKKKKKNVGVEKMGKKIVDLLMQNNQNKISFLGEENINNNSNTHHSSIIECIDLGEAENNIRKKLRSSQKTEQKTNTLAFQFESSFESISKKSEFDPFEKDGTKRKMVSDFLIQSRKMSEEEKKLLIKKKSREYRIGNCYQFNIIIDAYSIVFDVEVEIKRSEHLKTKIAISKIFNRYFMLYLQKNIREKKYRLLRICTIALKQLKMGNLKPQIWLQKFVMQHRNKLKGINISQYEFGSSSNYKRSNGSSSRNSGCQQSIQVASRRESGEIGRDQCDRKMKNSNGRENQDGGHLLEKQIINCGKDRKISPQSIIPTKQLLHSERRRPNAVKHAQNIIEDIKSSSSVEFLMSANKQKIIKNKRLLKQQARNQQLQQQVIKRQQKELKGKQAKQKIIEKRGRQQTRKQQQKIVVLSQQGQKVADIHLSRQKTKQVQQIYHTYPNDFKRKIAARLDEAIRCSIQYILKKKSQQLCLQQNILKYMYNQFGCYCSLKDGEHAGRETKEGSVGRELRYRAEINNGSTHREKSSGQLIPKQSIHEVRCGGGSNGHLNKVSSVVGSQNRVIMVQQQNSLGYIGKMSRNGQLAQQKIQYNTTEHIKSCEQGKKLNSQNMNKKVSQPSSSKLGTIPRSNDKNGNSYLENNVKIGNEVIKDKVLQMALAQRKRDETPQQRQIALFNILAVKLINFVRNTQGCTEQSIKDEVNKIYRSMPQFSGIPQGHVLKWLNNFVASNKILSEKQNWIQGGMNGDGDGEGKEIGKFMTSQSATNFMSMNGGSSIQLGRSQLKQKTMGKNNIGNLGKECQSLAEVEIVNARLNQRKKVVQGGREKK